MAVATAPVLVLGTSAMAMVVADLAEDCGHVVGGFVENLDRARCGAPLAGLPVHWIGEVAALASTHVAICGLGTTRRGRITAEAAAVGLRFTTIVHPTAHVSRRASVGSGSVIAPLVAIATGAELHEHVLVNRGASIGHDTVVGDHASVMPGAIVAGRCSIGARTWIGAGAVVVDDRSVGDDSMIAAGSVVTADVPANVLVAGSPARVVRRDYVAR